MQQTYNLGQKDRCSLFYHETGVKVKDVEPEIEHRIKAAHYISPDDKQAIMFLNVPMFSMMDTLMTGTASLSGWWAGNLYLPELWRIQYHDGNGKGTHYGGYWRAIGAVPKILQKLSEVWLTTCQHGRYLLPYLYQILESATNDPGSHKTHYQVSFGLAIGTCALLIALGMLAGLAPAYPQWPSNLSKGIR